MNQRSNSLGVNLIGVNLIRVIFVWVFLFSTLILSVGGSALAQETNQNKKTNQHKKTPDKLSLSGGICVSRAQALFQAGEVRGAIDLVEAFKKKDGSAHYYIHFLLGNYYLSLDQTQEAIECYRASVELNPIFSAGWLNLAKSLYESSLFARAALAFEQGYATCQTPDPIHLYYAAICHFQADAPQLALAMFERLTLAHPDKICLAWKEPLVNILFSLERYAQALPILEQLAANTKGEKRKTWQEILLSQYLNLNMKKKALAHAEFLTRTDPLEPRWWKVLCQIHLDGNRYRQGLSALIIYGYLTPMTPSERMLAGDLYVSLGVPVQAASFYQAALEGDQIPNQAPKLVSDQATDLAPNQVTDPATDLAPDPAPGLDQNLKKILKIGQAWCLAHEPDKALAWIEQGLTDFQNTCQDTCQNTRLLRLKAQILYQQQKYSQAGDAYERLVKSLLTQSPGKPNPKLLGPAWLMLGYAALNQDSQSHARLDRAQNAFSKAAAFKAQQKSARAALGQIKTLKTHLRQQENTDAKKPVKK